MTASPAADAGKNAVATIPARRSILQTIAHSYNMEPDAFEATLRGTIVPSGCSREQFAAFLLVANEHQLNPLTKEIYAFPAKGGGIVPIVGVDGWIKLMNRHPQFDGVEFSDKFDGEGNILSVTATIWRKDRRLATQITEYLEECKRPTEPWKQWPVRMLRHKAMIQCARVAFGFAGIVDEDEFERMAMVDVTDSVKTAAPPPPERPTRVKHPPKAEIAAPQQTAAAPPAPEPTPEEVEREADRIQRERAAAETGSGEAGEAGDGEGAEGPSDPAGAAEPPARPAFPTVSAKPTGAEARALTEFVRDQLAACATIEDVDAFEADYKGQISALPSGLQRGTRMQIGQRRVEINNPA